MTPHQPDKHLTCEIRKTYPAQLKEVIKYGGYLAEQIYNANDSDVYYKILPGETLAFTLWLQNKNFHNCHLSPNKFFHFSPLAPNKIFGFSLPALKKFWLSTFPQNTEPHDFIFWKSIGPMQKCCISFFVENLILYKMVKTTSRLHQ